jgi:hypothetical protein
MEWIASYAGWLFINIILSPIVPLAGIALVGFAPRIPNTQLLTQVKDGQLNWMAFGMCAQSLYDLSEGRRSCEKIAVIWPKAWEAMSIAAIALLTMSFLLASVGAIFVTPISRPTNLSRLNHYKIFFSSILIAFFSSVVYAFSHYAANPGCSAITK